MARRLRSNGADGWYHVFHRGIDKKLAGGGGRETSGKRELRRRVRLAEIARAVEPVMGGVCSERFGRRGGPGKALAMWAARRYGGLTLRETGEALGGLDYAAVSIALKRLERKAAANRDVRTQMARICALLKVPGSGTHCK